MPFNTKSVLTLLVALAAFAGIKSSVESMRPRQVPIHRPHLDPDTEEPEVPRIDVNLNVVRNLESTDTNMYWPGGCSGPTIGVGFDLGYATPSTVRMAFQGLVDSETMLVLLSAHGIHGVKSVQWVQNNPIHITRYEADVSFFRIAKVYWHETENRFGTDVDSLDPTVKGVILSLVMNYGGRNRALDTVQTELNRGDLIGLSETIANLSLGSTKDSSIQAALRKRRLLEHDVIRDVAKQPISASEVDPD
jgi:GH24 family phage-related lysozyme (muramidase)